MKDFVKRKEHRDIKNEAPSDAPQNIVVVAPKHIENQEVARRSP